jgi:Flp pilus assembly pilin Flp
MRATIAFLSSRLRDRKGITAAEYAVLAVAVVVAIGAAITSFGPLLTAQFVKIFD